MFQCDNTAGIACPAQRKPVPSVAPRCHGESRPILAMTRACAAQPASALPGNAAQRPAMTAPTAGFADARGGYDEQRFLHNHHNTMATLYLLEQGSELCCDGERLEIRRDDAVIGSAPLIKIDDILVFGNVGLTTPAIKRLLDRGIDVTFLTIYGRYHGRLVGAGTPHVALRRAQYRAADDAARSLAIAQACVRGKLHNCRALLQRVARNRSQVDPVVPETIAALDDYRERVQRGTRVSALLGVEGSATARYFRAYRSLFDPIWRFDGRKKRPPPDPVNVLLSLGYTLLNHKVLGAMQAVGFDPYQGYLHQIDHRRPALALDMMEEFRPLLIDSLVARICGDGRVTSADFSEGKPGDYPVLFSDAGKKRFIAAFEERMRSSVQHPEGADSRPGQVSYLRCMELQARRLARHVQGGAMYQPFETR